MTSVIVFVYLLVQNIKLISHIFAHPVTNVQN